MTRRKKSSMRKQWKDVEKKHANLFSTTHVKTENFELFRLGNMHGKNYPDSYDYTLALESKSGYDLIPTWLRDSVTQSIENEQRLRDDLDGIQRIPIVVLHQNGDLYDNDIVLIRSDLFRKLILSGLPRRII